MEEDRNVGSEKQRVRERERTSLGTESNGEERAKLWWEVRVHDRHTREKKEALNPALRWSLPPSDLLRGMPPPALEAGRNSEYEYQSSRRLGALRGKTQGQRKPEAHLSASDPW